MHLCFIFSSAPEKQGQKGNKSFIDEGGPLVFDSPSATPASPSEPL
jgi:hypothetical protein